MNILIASSIPYSKTSRGIDVITKYLSDLGHSVDHLCFYTKGKKEPKLVSENLRQLYFREAFFKQKFRIILPGVIITNYFKNILRKQKEIDFSQYDVAILEGGYPLYLMYAVECPIIYRQSDQIEVCFGSKGQYFKRLENEIYKKSISILSALDKKFLPKQFIEKYSFWHSGFIPPVVSVNSDKITKREKKIVYAGGGELDYSLIKKIAKQYPNYTFQIVGNHHKNFSRKNIIFSGLLQHEDYLQVILRASIFMIPFTSRYGETLYEQSYSAKLFVPMSIGIPILIKKHGMLQNTDREKKMYTYDTHEEAFLLLEKIIKNIEDKKESFNVSESTKDFLFSNLPEQKLKELDNYFKQILNEVPAR